MNSFIEIFKQMENSNTLPTGNISVNKLFHLHGVTDIESELFDAILSSSSFISFQEISKNFLSKKYTRLQIFNAFQSLESKNFLSYDREFRIIELHLQSVFS